jgi:hypothetical protein
MSILDKLKFWKRQAAEPAGPPPPEPLDLIAAFIIEERNAACAAFREQEEASGSDNLRGKLRARREAVEAFSERMLMETERLRAEIGK